MTRRVSGANGVTVAISCAAAAVFAAPTEAAATSTPAIRISSSNPMPACVTTERLDTFLSNQIRKRGYRLQPGHRNIAKWYRQHGEAHRVRWDYAFFQMALETNFLSFRRGNGKRGDVHPRQNNFAGLGTTGGGVPGDSYPNASTGVLAQIQHLVVYSGQRLARPTGHRTRLKQDVILKSVNKIVRRRPMTFGDLAGRWAADKRYGRSIKRLASLFYGEHCRGNQTKTAAKPSPARRVPIKKSKRIPVAKAAQRPQQIAKVPTPAAKPCRVQLASFGGTRAVLIENVTVDAINLTALSVQPGFEDAMTQNFIQSHAPTGKSLGTFDNRDAAVARAQELCHKRRVTSVK